jgi:SAM-dependent methyltransferase
METSVRERYSQGAKKLQEALCCPVDYDLDLLKLLPAEILEMDYGCGDPSRYVRPGEVVLDLGSGSGKVCYMAAQLVGAGGRVLGVDMNDDMLALARRYQSEMADKLGEDRVRFLKGLIQDLAVDLDAADAYLAENPIRSANDLSDFNAWQGRQCLERPLIAAASVDLVISNCVLNLVSDAEKQGLVHEIFRVLKPGGRVAIADIVSDEPVPPAMKADPELWSGCISGAFEESRFIRAFVDAGFVAIRLDKWSAAPWQTLEGIEFRSATLIAEKGHGSACIDRGHAAIYRGPYSEVRDEEGHVFPRGERIAVCERTFAMLTEGPYRNDFIGIAPKELQDPVAWCAPPNTKRSPAETKGGRQVVPKNCGSDADCCG